MLRTSLVGLYHHGNHSIRELFKKNKNIAVTRKAKQKTATINMKRSKTQQNDEQRQRQRQTADAERQRMHRQALSADQQAARHIVDAQRHRVAMEELSPDDTVFMAARQCNIDTFDESSVERLSLSEYNLECIYCGGIGFKSENLGTNKKPYFGSLCCNKGKIDLPLYPPLPPYLCHLVTPCRSPPQ